MASAEHMIHAPENAESSVGPCTAATAPRTFRAEPESTSAGPITTTSKASYYEILRSSALIGGSQLANIAIGILRTKAMALLLGPAGFGLFGLYGSVQNLAQSIAGLGINSSGVRQVAAAAGSDDTSRIAQTAAVLRRTAIVLGLLGALLLLALSRQVSQLTFGNTEHVAAVSLLSVAVFFSLVSGGQEALVQGMRRIGDLARMRVLGSFFGLCAAIPLVYFLGQRGVVPSLVVVAGAGILISWWYSRKIKLQPAAITLPEIRREASALLKLGSAFMASGLMTMGAAYVVRILILRRIGLEAMGLYQSAWTLGGLYIGFILTAMGADFYPRLTASIDHHHLANRLVNEQTLIGLLLAGPGVLATLTFAPLVIALFFSAKFAAAVPLLRWICLGSALQVITWPVGFIIVAMGKQVVFFFCELAWTLVAISLAWLCMKAFGLNGAGIAFFGSYAFHLLLTYPVARWLTGFRWSGENKRNCAVFVFLTGIVFLGSCMLSPWWAEGLGMIAAITSAFYSSRVLARYVPTHRLPRPLRFVCGLSRFTPE